MTKNEIIKCLTDTYGHPNSKKLGRKGKSALIQRLTEIQKNCPNKIIVNIPYLDIENIKN
ncbi:MAG: hypothetical protein ACRD8Z_09945 [Nitrososphaeraceae archaeon]